jgi:hypothetical protein
LPANTSNAARGAIAMPLVGAGGSLLFGSHTKQVMERTKVPRRVLHRVQPGLSPWRR